MTSIGTIIRLSFNRLRNRCFPLFWSIFTSSSSASPSSSIWRLALGRNMIFNLLNNFLSNSSIRIIRKLGLLEEHTVILLVGDKFRLFQSILQLLLGIALERRHPNDLLSFLSLLSYILLHFVKDLHFLLCTLSVKNLFRPFQQCWVHGLVIVSDIRADIVAWLRKRIWRINSKTLGWLRIWLRRATVSSILHI